MVNFRDALCMKMKRMDDLQDIEWRVSNAPVAYPQAVSVMEERVAKIIQGEASEMVWLLEHPPLYTAGTSARPSDLLEQRFPVFQSGRGGQYTYHGPGQRIGYVMLDLRARKQDVRCFVSTLEQWLINTLQVFGIKGERREDRVGVWVREGERDSKIAALGIRVRRWVSLHGVSLNVDPDLSHFDGIVPCGVREYGVTSLRQLGVSASMSQVDEALRQEFFRLF